MKVVYISLGVYVMLCLNLHACQAPEHAEHKTVTCRLATAADTPGVKTVMDEHAVKDNDKIVVVPERFRSQVIASSIGRGRLYVAYDTVANVIAGFKKLFIVNDPQERHDIACNELRYKGDNAQRVDGSVHVYCNSACQFITSNCKPLCMFSDDQVITIYTGGDFTQTTYRKHGINTTLTRVAFEHICPEILNQVKDAGKKVIALVYGLTHLNDYALNGSGTSRTPGLRKLFVEFITSLGYTNIIRIFHERFKSFMPTFDPKSAQCIPLPDDQAISGYGNVLYYILPNQSTQNN